MFKQSPTSAPQPSSGIGVAAAVVGGLTLLGGIAAALAGSGKKPPPLGKPPASTGKRGCKCGR